MDETLAPVAASDEAGTAGGGGGRGRAEIDMSAPFESVREAVDRFGGGAAWNPRLIKRMFASKKHEQFEEAEPVNVEEQAAQLEKELAIKERETLDVLKELETTKRIIADLKLKIHKETADATSVAAETDRTKVYPLTDSEGHCSGNLDDDVNMEGPEDEHASKPPSLVLMELKQAKENLNRNTCDLAAIRASVEFLCDDIAKEKSLLERSREKLSFTTAMISSLQDELDQTTQKLQTLKDLQRRRENPSDIFIEIKKMTSEIEQLRNMANASKTEAMILTAEIEQTKASISTAEVRCLAANKMEEAAKAAEALALAEIKALLSSEASAEDDQGTEGVILSVEEYFMLASKAQEADERSRKKIEDAMLQVDEANHSKLDSLKKVGEAKAEVEKCKEALEEALRRVEAANRGKLAVEESLRRWRSEHGQRRWSIQSSTKFKNAAHHRKDSRTMDLIADSSKGSLKPTLSIGQILSLKLMGPDEYDKSVWEKENEKPIVSLGQILNRKHGILSTEGAAPRKQYSGKRKKFAFTGLSILLAKQSKHKKKRQLISS